MMRRKFEEQSSNVEGRLQNPRMDAGKTRTSTFASYFATPIFGQTAFSEHRSHWGFRAEQTLRP